MIGVNRRRVMGGGGEEPLPEGVVRIEYLGCDNAQFINTGIVPNASMVWTIDTSIISTGNGSLNGLFESSNKRYMIGANQNVQFGTDAVFNTSIQNDGERHTYCIDGPNKRYLFDGIEVGTFSAFPSLSYTIFLMARRYNNTTDFRLRGKFYGSSIMQQGSYIIDMIPVRRGTIGYLYDKVSKQLFANDGTDVFVLGPDIN